MFHKPPLCALAIIAAAFAPTTPALAQGRLGVLQHGQYLCALPGNAAGLAWNEQPRANFSITGASSYRAASGEGTYLLTDKQLEFTRGPFKGKRFLLMSSGLLHELSGDGQLGRMRCHRAGPLPD